MRDYSSVMYARSHFPESTHSDSICGYTAKWNSMNVRCVISSLIKKSVGRLIWSLIIQTCVIFSRNAKFSSLEFTKLPNVDTKFYRSTENITNQPSKWFIKSHIQNLVQKQTIYISACWVVSFFKDIDFPFKI